MEEGAAFLDSLTPAERDDLFARGGRRKLRRGTFLFSEGDASEHVAVVLAGRVKASSFTTDGREVVLAVRGPGELLGELAALDRQTRSASVIALEPLEVLVVPADGFRDFLEAHARVAVSLLQTLSRRQRDADRKRIEFGAHDTEGRVGLRIVELAERYGEATEGGIRIELPLTQEELAGWTGSSREAVSKALKTLREHGLIETGRRTILVRDLAALRARLGD